MHTRAWRRPGGARAPIDADALAHVAEVGRGEEADPVATRFQDAGCKRGGGALALGARNVQHARVLQLTVKAERLHAVTAMARSAAC